MKFKKKISLAFQTRKFLHLFLLFGLILSIHLDSNGSQINLENCATNCICGNGENLPPISWFNFENFSISPNKTVELDNVLNDYNVYNVDLKIIQESNNNLCDQPCTSSNVIGVINLNQTNATDVIRFTSNAMHPYAIELVVVDDYETISIFSESDILNQTTFSGKETVVQQSSGLPAVIETAYYNDLDGISITGSGNGLTDAATVMVITEPATDLIIRYEGNGIKHGTFRIGRVELSAEKKNSISLTDETNAPSNINNFAGQGMAIDYNAKEVFTSSNNSISRFQIVNDNSWSFLEHYDMLTAINETNIYCGNTDQNRIYDHIGAIDYHDSYLWIGLFDTEKVNPVCAAVAKVKVNNFDLNDDSFVVEDVYYTDEVRRIDATAFDGNYLWLSASSGIYRFAVSDFGNHTLNNGKRLNAHPYSLGGDFIHNENYDPELSHSLYAQGLRIVPGNETTPDRLLAIFPNFRQCNQDESENTEFCHDYCESDSDQMCSHHMPAPFTGLYEFDISGNIEDTAVPTRIWHIPHDTGGGTVFQHLEGFDFVPEQTNQIYITDSGGKQIDKLEIQELNYTATKNPSFLKWFNLNDFSILPNTAPGTQTLTNVLSGYNIHGVDLQIIEESNNNLCDDTYLCNGNTVGGLNINQKNATDVIRIKANTTQQYVVELSIVDQDEIISIFSESIISGQTYSGTEAVVFQSNGLPATIETAYYNGLEGISIRGAGYGLTNSATVTIITDPATDLIIRYEGLHSVQTKYANLKIGRIQCDDVNPLKNLTQLTTQALKTGVDEIDSELVVSPNPISGQFSISFENINEGKMKICVYNLNMQLIYESTSFIQAGIYHDKIDFPEKLGTGIYFLEVITDGQYFNKKIVVNR